MIKYNIVMCCYYKILVNVAGSCLLRTLHTPNQELHRGHIYQDFIIKTHHYIVFYHFNNS